MTRTTSFNAYYSESKAIIYETGDNLQNKEGYVRFNHGKKEAVFVLPSVLNEIANSEEPGKRYTLYHFKDNEKIDMTRECIIVRSNSGIRAPDNSIVFQSQERPDFVIYLMPSVELE